MSKAQDEENEFVERYREMCGGLSHSTEIALRAGFASGYRVAYDFAIRVGREEKRCEFMRAISPEPEPLQ